MNTTDVDLTAACEMAVLELHAHHRMLTGFDYGSGQRNKELIRRRRTLDHETSMLAYRIEHGLMTGAPREDLPWDELGTAATKLLHPRLVRIRRESERWPTTSRARAQTALVRTLTHFGVDAS